MSSLKSRKRTERITNALCFIALIFLTCLCMLPIWWIFRSSLMSNAELFKWPPAFFPPRWLFSNYANTLEYFKFWTYLKNTMIIIVPSVIFGTITATMCGYAFARLRFRLRNFLFTLCVGSMLLPTMVTLIPLYIMWTKFFNMSNTFWPLILPYLCGGGAFNIFLIRQFVRSIPRELDEAATIDGAGYFRILLNVIVPSIKSAMIVVAMFHFIQIWNDLLQQLADEARAEGHHVRVVVLARQAGGYRVGQQGAADAVHLVRRDGNADARRAHHDAAFTRAGRDSLGRRAGKVWIVAAVLRKRAEIHAFHTARSQMGLHGLLQRQRAVVTGNCNFHKITSCIRT